MLLMFVDLIINDRQFIVFLAWYKLAYKVKRIKGLSFFNEVY